MGTAFWVWVPCQYTCSLRCTLHVGAVHCCPWCFLRASWAGGGGMLRDLVPCCLGDHHTTRAWWHVWRGSLHVGEGSTCAGGLLYAVLSVVVGSIRSGLDSTVFDRGWKYPIARAGTSFNLHSKPVAASRTVNSFAHGTWRASIRTWCVSGGLSTECPWRCPQLLQQRP